MKDFWGCSAPAIVMLFVLGFIAVMLWPTQGCGGAAPPAIARSNVKQLATATLIYCSDYDERFPHGTAMPGIRAAIFPYLKNRPLLEPVATGYCEPIFNFNLAGAGQHQPPIGFSPGNIPTDTVVWSVVADTKDFRKAIRSAQDSSTRAVSWVELASSFCYQYDRTGVKLAPADYMTSEDPLK